jgi:ATP-dependent RNA helicase RhlE
MYKAIVFTRTKHRASKVAKVLGKRGIDSEALHGDKSQAARRRTIGAFKRGSLQVLVATDVASRGLDIDDVTHVVNFEIPNEPETYVHRVGRTARAGAEGTALSLCDTAEIAYLRGIEKLMESRVHVFRDHRFHVEPKTTHQGRKPQRANGGNRRSSAGRGRSGTRSRDAAGPGNPRAGGSRGGSNRGGKASPRGRGRKR